MVCAYLEDLGPVVMSARPQARLYYDCTEARNSHHAVAIVAPKCPATPTDVMVFPGELYDLDPSTKEVA